MHRFFVPPEILRSDPVVLPPETSHQVANVLHMKEGQSITLLDNAGSEYITELVTVGNKVVLGRVVEIWPSVSEPATEITLYLAMTQREKFEWALQKSCEAGAAIFVPVISSRSLVQTITEGRAKNERWQKILQEAAEQSGRGRIPTLLEPQRYGQALAHARQNSLVSLVAWEKEEKTSLKQALRKIKPASKIGIFIGPEGGFAEDEIALACQVGAIPVSLGSRTLRMETAAVVMVSLILYQLEN